MTMLVHMVDWLEAMRARREPNATGRSRAFRIPLSVSWAAQAYWTGKKFYWILGARKLADRRYDSFSTLRSDKTAVATTLLNSMEESVIGYWISQMRMVYMIRFVLLLLTASAPCFFGGRNRLAMSGLCK